MTLQEAIDAATWEDVISFVEGLPDDVNLRFGNVCLLCPVSRYLAAKIEKPGFVAVGFVSADLLKDEASLSRVKETVLLNQVLRKVVSLFGRLSPTRSSKTAFLAEARRFNG